MLESLRKSTGSWLAKIFIGLLVFSFAIWGIGDMFRGASERDVAQVGNVKISTELFRQLYQDRLQQLARQFGRGLTPDQARAMGVDRQLLSELVSETVLDEKARALGLGIDEDVLVRRIHENPLFQGPGGNFDPFRFNEILRSSGYTEARYIEAERRLLLRQQLARALGGDLTPPTVLGNALRQYETEQRSIEYVELGPEQAGDIPAPSDAELAAYFEENRAAFRAPEYRSLVVVPLTPETLAAAVDIPDDELRQAFEERRDSFAAPERREVEQIVFANEAEAAAAAQRIAAGASFADIVAEQELSASDVSLGLVSRREILDSAVADATFRLAEGEVSEPIPGRFGPVLVHVVNIEPGKEASFDDVAETLRQELARGYAHRDLLDYYDRIEDERAAGLTLAEAAAKLQVKPITIDAVDRSGRDPDGNPVENIPAFGDVLEGAFDAAVGLETDPVSLRGGDGYVWYEVTQVTPARDRSLDEIRDRVETRWRNEQVAQRLVERAEAIRSKVATGESLAAAAEGLPVDTRGELRRGRSAEGLSNAALAAVFETPQNQAGIGVAGDGVGRIVFRVTSVDVPADGEIAPQLTAEITSAMQDDLLVQYVMRLQDEIGVTVNEAALRSVTGAVEN